MSTIDDSIREFLDGCHYATLATQNEDGSIHQTPIWYLFEDNQLFFMSNSGARKFKNLSERPSISLLIDSRRHQAREQWVSTTGTAEVIDDEERSKEISLKILKRYITEAGLEHPELGPIFLASGNVTIRLMPDSWKSWAMKDMDDNYFNGMLGQDPDKWLFTVD